MKNYKKIKYRIKNNYLISKINDENMCFIYTLARLLKIKDSSFINSTQTFKGLSHRFEIFLKKRNITFINDSKATSFTATQFALSSLEKYILDIGRFTKRGDKFYLSKYKKNIVKCYIIGEHLNFFKKSNKRKITFFCNKKFK